MPKVKYLDSISVGLSQIDNLFRIFLNHLHVLSRSNHTPYKLAFDPAFHIYHMQISEENLYIQIEKQIEQLSSEIQSKKFENFQIIFQLFKEDSSLKQSYITNLFKPKKQVIQEFLLHVTITPQTKLTSRSLGSACLSLKRKLETLLNYTQKNRETLNKIPNLSARAYIKSHF